MWAKRGTRPRAPRDQRYEWAYIFGAVCPQRSATAALVLPCANAEAMNLHLVEISKQVAKRRHAIFARRSASGRVRLQGWEDRSGHYRLAGALSLKISTE